MYKKADMKISIQESQKSDKLYIMISVKEY